MANSVPSASFSPINWIQEEASDFSPSWRNSAVRIPVLPLFSETNSTPISEENVLPFRPNVPADEKSFSSPHSSVSSTRGDFGDEILADMSQSFDRPGPLLESLSENVKAIAESMINRLHAWTTDRDFQEIRSLLMPFLSRGPSGELTPRLIQYYDAGVEAFPEKKPIYENAKEIYAQDPALACFVFLSYIYKHDSRIAMRIFSSADYLDSCRGILARIP